MFVAKDKRIVVMQTNLINSILKKEAGAGKLFSCFFYFFKREFRNNFIGQLPFIFALKADFHYLAAIFTILKSIFSICKFTYASKVQTNSSQTFRRIFNGR